MTKKKKIEKKKHTYQGQTGFLSSGDGSHDFAVKVKVHKGRHREFSHSRVASPGSPHVFQQQVLVMGHDHCYHSIIRRVLNEKQYFIN